MDSRVLLFIVSLAILGMSHSVLFPYYIGVEITHYTFTFVASSCSADSSDPDYCGLMKAVVGIVSKNPVKVAGPYVIHESVPVLGNIDVTLKNIEVSLEHATLDSCDEHVCTGPKHAQESSFC